MGCGCFLAASQAALAPYKHWRQRAADRQKFWSLSHGFKLGRSLAKWGEHDDDHDDTDHDGDDKLEPRDPQEEDEQLQEAIRQSLGDASSIWFS